MNTGIQFENRLRESPSQNVLAYEYYYNGAGLAIEDFNRDGYPDLYFVSNLEDNQFYLNKGALQFEEATQVAGLSGKKGFSTGVATVDINSDGWMDIYLCKSGRFTNPDARRNELFVNQGPGEDGIPRFKESAATYGLDLPAYSTQASFFDYDKDGDLDMFLINHDIDTYPLDAIPQLQQEPSPLVGDMLFQNQNGTFVDVTQVAGLVNNKLGFGLGIGVGDLNQDNWPDVYVSTDYSGRDHLYINQQDGTFTEMIRDLTTHTSFYSMGNDIADINNDGFLDIINLDMVAADNYGIKTSMSAMNPEQFQKLIDQGLHHQYMYNTLLLNSGTASPNELPRFSDIAQLAGVSNTGWSWAPLLFDFDNDGLRDLFVSNGIKRNIRNNDAVKQIEQIKPILDQTNSPQERARYIQQMLNLFPYHRTPNYFFHHTGNLTFENINKEIGVDSLPTASNGAAYSDLDRDGDLDLVINNVDQAAMVFKNNSREAGRGNYLQILLKGPKDNTAGIGAKILLKQGARQYIQEVYSTRGYMSSVESLIHIGLASGASIQELKIIWPDELEQILPDIRPNQFLEISYQAENPSRKTTKASQPPLFSDITEAAGIKHRHIENEFDDFARESLLPHRMSTAGPAFAQADINQDGLEDLFIGGAAGYPATLLIQDINGQFSPSSSVIWEQEKSFEDVAACFVDVDADGDADLIIGGGSNERPQEDPSYALRLYENNGMGKFSIMPDVLPDLSISVGVLTAQDIDGDGDQDLFVGGRQIPGKYPFPANSYLLLNEFSNGQIKYLNGTESWAPYLKEFGMITDAIWVDLNQDTRPDLITIGEWMSPNVLINTGRSLEDQTASYQLTNQSGWWNSIAAADIDRDGDIDLIAGNLGLNYKYKSLPDEPFTIYADDFDRNGSIDIVLGYYETGTLFPLRGRECSSNQMPFIKTKFPSYHAFGHATVTDVFGQEQLKSALRYEATTFASHYFENDGAGSFIAHQLPPIAQISSVNAILLEDVDQDGHTDVLVAGNLYGSEVETPRNDASIGCLLAGNGKGNWETVSPTQSGILIDGEVKHLSIIHLGKNQRPAIVVCKNNDFIQILGFSK